LKRTLWRSHFYRNFIASYKSELLAYMLLWWW